MTDPNGEENNDDKTNAGDTKTTSKLSFSLGARKKKKSSASTSVTAADFGSVSSNHQENPLSSALPSQNQGPLVIPLSQPTQSLLTRIKQEGTGDNDEQKNSANNVTEAAAKPATLESSNNEPESPVIASSSASNNNINNNTPIMQPKNSHEDINSRDQLHRDLEQLPDEADEESYEQVPVSSFGAALLRGMGWNDKDTSTTSGKKPGDAMPRPHRLGLGAIPKASTDAMADMPPVLSGRRGKKAKPLSVAQLKQQEEFDKKRELQKQQDKQRTLQVGSIVFVKHAKTARAKIIQLQGVPGLNMVSVQLEHDVEPSGIKRGQLGGLVPRQELEQAPFKIPAAERQGWRDDKNNDRRSDKDRSKGGDRRRDRSRSRSRERDRDRKPDRTKRDGDGSDKRRRERSNSPRREDRDNNRKRDRKDRDQDGDRRRERSRSRSRERDSRKRDRKDRDRDRDGGRRRDEKSRKKSRSERDDRDEKPLWMIPNIRVRVVTEKLGKRYFRQKGVIIDVTQRHGATLRMDMVDGSSGNSTVLEHVPERYLETALPKSGGQAVVLAGSNKWAKGLLVERNSKTSQGSIQVFEDMDIITLSLDDIAEWCGPLDDDLG